MIKRTPLGPYSKRMPMVLGGPEGVVVFGISKDPCSRFRWDVLRSADIPADTRAVARAGPKVDTWSKVDVACVKSLRLCLQGVYPQRRVEGAPV